MQVPDEVARGVVDHDALVEGVEAEKAILPAFGFAAEVVGVKTAELNDGGGVLRGGHSEEGVAGSGGRGHAVLSVSECCVVAPVVVPVCRGADEVGDVERTWQQPWKRDQSTWFNRGTTSYTPYKYVSTRDIHDGRCLWLFQTLPAFKRRHRLSQPLSLISSTISSPTSNTTTITISHNHTTNLL